jgi:hypothetical protein
MSETNNYNKIITNIAIVRLFYLVIILLSKIKIWTKIILIASFDYIKHSLICLLSGKKIIVSKNEYYQTLDKFFDSVENGIILYLVYTHKLLSPIYTKVISIVYFYRLIGVGNYLIFKKDRKMLVYFPDIFKELLLISYLCEFKFNNDKKIFIYLLLISIVIKVYIEYKFHYEKSGLSSI